MVPQTAPTAEVSCARVSPDGKLLAIGDESGTIKLFHLRTMKEIKSVVAHAGFIRDVVFSPDSRLMLSVGADKGVRLWEVKSGKLLAEPFADKMCYSARFRDANECFVIAEGSIMSFTLADGKSKKLFTLEQGKWFRGVISEDLEYVVVTNRYNMNTPKDEQELAVYSVASGKAIYSYRKKYSYGGYFPEKLFSARIVAGRRLLVGHDNGIAKINLDSKSSAFEPIALNGNPDCLNFQVSFAQTGNRLGVLGHGVVYIYNSLDDRVEKQIKANDPLNEQLVALSSDGSKAYVITRKYDSITSVDIESERMLDSKRIKGDRMVFAQYDSRTRTIALGNSASPVIGLWSFDDLKFNAIADSCANDIGRYAAISPASPTLITVGQGRRQGVYDENALSLIDLTTGYQARRVHDPTARATLCLEFTPDGNRVLIGKIQQNIDVLDVRSGRLTPTSIGSYSHWVKCFNDGDRIATGKNLAVWSLGKHVKLYDFDVDAADASDVRYQFALSPDQSMLAMSYFGKKVEGRYVAVFDAASGKFLRKMLNARSAGWVWGRKDPGGNNFPVAFSGTSDLLAAGSNDNLIRIWNPRTGDLIKTLTGHSGSISSLSFIENDRFLLSASMDGTARLWNLKTGHWVAIAVAPDFKSWAVFDSDGYWDASANGGELVAMTNGAECWNIDQFAVRNNRPDRILQRIGATNLSAIALYQKQYTKRLRRSGLPETEKPWTPDIPVATIKSQAVSGKFAEVEFTLSDIFSGLKTYNIYVNDVPIFGAGGMEVNGKEYADKASIELTPGRNKIEVTCINNSGYESYRAVSYAEYPAQGRGDLYFLGFGVSRYSNPAYNLQFADKDALDLEKAFKTVKGFNNVFTRVYTNEQVTPENIKTAKDFVKNARVDDTFVLFIAGHGMYDRRGEPAYYYLTHFADTANLAQTATRFELVEELLQGIAPRNKLFLMDACESGEVDEEDGKTSTAYQTLLALGITRRGFKKVGSAPDGVTGVAASGTMLPGKANYLYQRDRYIFNDLSRRSGAIVFSSSRGSEPSQERKDIKQGLFTYHILEALTTPNADFDKNGFVSTDELREYVSTRVAMSSGNTQHPTVDRDNIYQKFGFQVK
jgi:WD40 repeat protein